MKTFSLQNAMDRQARLVVDGLKVTLYTKNETIETIINHPAKNLGASSGLHYLYTEDSRVHFWHYDNLSWNYTTKCGVVYRSDLYKFPTSAKRKRFSKQLQELQLCLNQKSSL